MLNMRNSLCSCTGLKGGIPGGGGGGGGGVGGGNFNYTFQGDPHEIFAEFFGGRNPYQQFFGGNGGMDEEMDTDDPFASFGMGGMGGFPRSFNKRGHGGRMEKKQDPPVIHDLRVSLEEVFNGCTKKMKISRKRLNPDGRTTRTEEKVLTVEVKKGWKEGTKVTFPKEGDETQTNIPADVIFVVKDKPHPVYRRDGSDIIYPQKITLKQVRRSFKRYILSTYRFYIVLLFLILLISRCLRCSSLGSVWLHC